jgi:hypothetical protein
MAGVFGKISVRKGIPMLRLVVTVVVAVSLFLGTRWDFTWWTTWWIGVIAILAGHGAEALLKGGVQPPDPRTAEATPADRQWELKMPLKEASAAAGRGQRDRAITLLEQGPQQADDQPNAELPPRQ